MVALVLRPYVDRTRPALAYCEQDSSLTLAEGLDEYYDANRGIVARPENLPPASAALFRSHDICHVIFGLDTTLADETMADTRTLLSCDVGWRRYVAYINDPMAKKVFEALGLWRAVIITLRTMPRILRAVRENWRMKRKWPWVPPTAFELRTLAGLRREFGIRVI